MCVYVHIARRSAAIRYSSSRLLREIFSHARKERKTKKTNQIEKRKDKKMAKFSGMPDEAITFSSSAAPASVLRVSYLD